MMPKLRWLFIGALCMPLAFRAQSTLNSLVVHADAGKETISRFIYGQFAAHLGRCIYGGLWVGEKSSIPNTRGIRSDVVAALKNAKVAAIRWPGGCFADGYHWRVGIGPRADRPGTVNTTCGGIMSAESYANEFARYSYFLKNSVDGWLQGYLGGFSLHCYTVPDWNHS